MDDKSKRLPKRKRLVLDAELETKIKDLFEKYALISLVLLCAVLFNTFNIYWPVTLAIVCTLHNCYGLSIPLQKLLYRFMLMEVNCYSKHYFFNVSDSRRTGTVANLSRRILIMTSKFRLPRFPISLDRWVWKFLKERRGSMLMKPLLLKILKAKAMWKKGIVHLTQMFLGKVHWINRRTYLTFLC